MEQEKIKSRGRPRSFDRDKVLAHVMELFWRRGYRNVSFHEISQEVGLTRASLYHAFDTKEALFLEALQHYFKQSPAAALAHIQAGDPVGPVLYTLFQDLAHMYMTDYQKRGCMSVNCMNELMGGDDDLSTGVTRMYEEIKQSLKSLVCQAIAQQELPKETHPECTANMILVFMNGLSIFSKSNTEKKVLDDLITDFMSKIGFNCT